jgi:hypothetical protein
MSTDRGDEIADVWTSSEQKARKEHTCCACKESILPGHRYIKTTCIFEGEVDTWKHCLRCHAMYQALNEKCWKASDGEEVADIQLNCGHEYEKKWGEKPPDDLAELAFLLPGEKPGTLLRKEVANG